MPHRRPRQVPLTAHRAVIPCRFAPMFLSLTEVSHLKLIDKPQFISPPKTKSPAYGVSRGFIMIPDQWVFFIPASTSTNFSKGAFSTNIS